MSDCIWQVEEQGLEPDTENAAVDDEEEEDEEEEEEEGGGEISIKQEKGKKVQRGRKRRKRRLTFTPRKLNKIYQCEQCPARFARDTQLKYHSKVHLDDQTEVRLHSSLPWETVSLHQNYFNRPAENLGQ